MLDNPGAVMVRLEEIEADLAVRQLELEEAAMDFARAKRDYERAESLAFVANSIGPQEERKHKARIAAGEDGTYWLAFGRWEGLKRVVNVLEARATIAQSVLKAQTHV